MPMLLFPLLAEMSYCQKVYSYCNSFRLLVNHVKRVPSELDLGEFALSNLLAIFPKDHRHWNKGDCNKT